MCATHPFLGYVRIGAELLSSWASASVEKKLLGNMRLDCKSKVLSCPGNIYCFKVANVATVLVFFNRNGYVSPVVCRPTTQRARRTNCVVSLRPSATEWRCVKHNRLPRGTRIPTSVFGIGLEHTFAESCKHQTNLLSFKVDVCVVDV